MMTTFVLLALLPFVDAPTWRNHRARLKQSEHDRSTAREITVLGLLGVTSGLLLRSPTPALSSLLTGVTLFVFGGALRFWSIRTLGHFFTLTLQVNPEQRVVRSGPYRRLRHPSYLGGELALLGIGLTCGNAFAAIAMVLPMVIAHVRRISIEERMMEHSMGEPWREHARQTWRLIPFVY